MKLYDTKAKSWVKILMLIAVFVAMTIFGSVLAIPFLSNFQITLSAQAVSSIVMFGGTAFLYCLLFERKKFLKETFCSGVDIKWLLTALALWIVGMPLLSSISVDSDYGDMLTSLVSDTSVIGLLWLIIVMALFPAILEEWIFRGILQRFFIKLTKHVWIGILLTSSIFSLIHFDMPNFFARFLLGIVLGLLFQYSGNIWTNIFYHFINNCVAAIRMWFYVKDGDSSFDNYDFPLFAVILSAVLLIAFVVYNEQKNTKSVKSNYMETEEEDFEQLSDEINS